MSKAFLQITLTIKEANRGAAAAVYSKYKAPFLQEIAGATSKELLIRTEDVQVLHGFISTEHAQAYLSTELFLKDVVTELSPLLDKDPEVRIYSVA